ncbi:hypothetical protein FHL15_007656 [Xylaria flabelliformis]|uniref:AAA+ ATPase domain-containing protein n=1 Tax=Xylaria flabelliformis TaxID=2512241 RepID=A0A553HTZ6_9PEZI|nr:hypothetical protein FHL15_007656 [Xylaria flabelliformis]
MEDNNSITSFEDIADRTRRTPRFGAPTGLVIDTSSSVDFTEDDVPDVCYVLQYKEFRKGVVEIHRGSKPINSDIGNTLGEGAQKGKKKPVLEIVTVVSTAFRNNRPIYNCHQRGGMRPPPRPLYITSPDDSEDESDAQIIKSESTTMMIYSRHLINALAAVVTYYPGKFFTGDEVKIEAPYSILVHHRAALARYKTSQPDTHDEEYAATTAKHIDVLLGFLEQTYGQLIRDEDERNNRKTPSATFDWLWLVLQPGEVIYTRYDSTWTPFAISSVSKKAANNLDAPYAYSIDCWNYMYSDGHLRREMHTFDIQPFSGEEAIQNLSVIPARFFTGADKDMSPSEVATKQIQLGKLVWELYKKPSYKTYDGDLMTKSPHGNVNYRKCPVGYMSGRVIVDGEGYERNWQQRSVKGHRRFDDMDMMPPPRGPQTPYDQLPYFASRCGCIACSKDERSNELSRYAVFQDLDPRRDDAPEDDLYFHVISKVVAGFLLGERRWGHFHVEKLCDVKFDREAFKYLVLDDDIKTTVKSLIGKFASVGGQVSAWPSDFVKNKGQGRIFLLHGSPGVGKTCTAECVAELTHRPLLSLTSGDLSTDANQVEQNLEYFLALGERFGAIVLLDEADVYLESRRNRDIERNGLVSVFLRALEYYRGVLFLTTNRVQTFDNAFTSRIHVALHYGALTDRDRERIWSNGFERLERESNGRVRAAVTAREYAWGSADVRSLRLNGREIRNALQTAVALAETEALEDEANVVMVTDKHLRSVVRMSRGFKNFMRRRRLRDDDDDDVVLTYEEDDRAGLRDDEIPVFSDSDDGIRRRRYSSS